MARKSRGLGAEILHGLREIKRGELGRDVAQGSAGYNCNTKGIVPYAAA